MKASHPEGGQPSADKHTARTPKHTGLTSLNIEAYEALPLNIRFAKQKKERIER